MPPKPPLLMQSTWSPGRSAASVNPFIRSRPSFLLEPLQQLHDLRLDGHLPQLFAAALLEVHVVADFVASCRKAGIKPGDAAALLVVPIGYVVFGEQMSGMDAGPGTEPGTLGFFIGVWVVMMAAMMFPSVAPTVALYSSMTKSRSPVAPLPPGAVVPPHAATRPASRMMRAIGNATARVTGMALY